MRDLATFIAPTTVHTNHSNDYHVDDFLDEPTHVAIIKANTFNKLGVVYDYVILQFYHFTYLY
jgi:uncharacterized protein YkwD